MNSLVEQNEPMRSSSPLKKLSADITKIVDDMPESSSPRKKNKKKKR